MPFRGLIGALQIPGRRNFLRIRNLKDAIYSRKWINLDEAINLLADKSTNATA